MFTLVAVFYNEADVDIGNWLRDVGFLLEETSLVLDAPILSPAASTIGALTLKYLPTYWP